MRSPRIAGLDRYATACYHCNMLSHNFEKYHGGDIRPPRGDIWVSLSRQSQFYLNKKAFEVLGSPEAVSLYFSREDAAIAIEPAFPSFHENLRVRRGMNGYHISALGFCTHYGITPQKTIRFIDPVLTPEKQLILRLTQTTLVGANRAHHADPARD